jgi:hypothetical protein
MTEAQLTGSTGVSDLMALWHRVGIEETLYRWADLADRQMPEAAGQMLTEDCDVDYGPRFPNGPVKGRQAYVDYMAESMGDSPIGEHSNSVVRTKGVSHHFMNVQVDVRSDDHAEVVSKSVSWTMHRSGEARVHWSTYYDTFRNTPEGWRISARRTVRHGASVREGS